MANAKIPGRRSDSKIISFESDADISWGVVLRVRCAAPSCTNRARLTSAEHPTDTAALQSTFDQARLIGWGFFAGKSYCPQHLPVHDHPVVGDERGKHRLPPELEFDHIDHRTIKTPVNKLVQIAADQRAKIEKSKQNKGKKPPV